MADCALVLSNVLCFCVNKYGKVSVKSLKSMLSDFYSVEDLNEAKLRLLHDIKQLNLQLNIPHVTQRRACEGRLGLETNDILTLVTFIDESKLFDKLPRYVASSPDDMPSSRLYERDFEVLMSLMRNMNDNIMSFKSAMATINNQVSTLQAQAQAWPSLPVPACQAYNAQGATSRVQVGSTATTSSALKPSAGNSMETETDYTQTASCTNWATAASTPIHQSNRFAVLSSVSEDNDDDIVAHPYEMVQHRRDKRRRTQSSDQNRRLDKPQSQQSSQHQTRSVHRDGEQQPQQPQQQVSQQQQLRKTVLGKSTNVTNVAAAKKLRKRAVFCVDNVKPTCSVDDIIGLVNAWSIATISCFAVKTRRRRSEEVAPTDRKAFRLCIFDEDKEKLLNPAIWPDSVTVSHWYFKPPEAPSAAPNENTNDISSDNEQVKKDVWRRPKRLQRMMSPSLLQLLLLLLQISSCPMRMAITLLFQLSV